MDQFKSPEENLDLLIYGIENAPDGILLVKKNAEITYANQKMGDYLNYTQEELVGKYIYELDPNFSEKNWSDHWAKVKEQGKIVLESRLKRKNEDLLPVALSINHLVHQNKERHLTFVRDITEQKERQKKLEQVRDEYQNLINSMSDAVIVHDLKGNFLTVNNEAVERLGYSRKEFQNLSTQDIDTPEHAQYVEEIIQKIADKGKLIFETVHVSKQGDKIPVEISSSLIKYKGKNAILSVARDITARKKAQRALKKSERRFRELLENVNLIAISLNTEGKITFCNDFFLQLTGWNREEVLGEDWFEIAIPEEEQENLKENIFQEALKTGGYPAHHENVILTHNGEERIIDWSNTVLKDNNGNVEGITSIGRDITERKQAEQEKEEMRKQMFQSQKLESIGQLAGGIAHDFNNLLTVIQGHIQMSKGKVDSDSPLKSHIEQINKAANRASDLTRQLLLFSRKKEARFEPVDLNQIIINLRKMLARLIGEDINININLADDLWTVYADKGQMEQVITNLSVNARDAINRGGEIQINTQNSHLSEKRITDSPKLSSKQYVQLEVKDNGKGMDQETQQNIFEPFFTTKDKGEGTGMGLSVVHGITKQHHGIIDVDSEQGQGTSFKIYLPAHPDMDSSDNNKPVDINYYKGDQEGILIVEDDPDVLEFVAKGLGNSNYNTFKAKSAEEAIKIYNQNKDQIQLVVSDIIMPGMRGDRLAEELQKANSELDIILNSGYTDRKVDQSNLEKKYTFLSKPYKLRDLLETIQETLD